MMSTVNLIRKICYVDVDTHDHLTVKSAFLVLISAERVTLCLNSLINNNKKIDLMASSNYRKTRTQFTAAGTRSLKGNAQVL